MLTQPCCPGDGRQQVYCEVFLSNLCRVPSARFTGCVTVFSVAWLEEVSVFPITNPSATIRTKEPPSHPVGEVNSVIVAENCMMRWCTQQHVTDFSPDPLVHRTISRRFKLDRVLWSIHTVCLRDTRTGTGKKWVVWDYTEHFTLHRDRNPIVSYCAGPGPGASSGPRVRQCD